MGDVVLWDSARGYSSQQVDYGDVTLVAMKMKATDNLANQTNQQVNFIVTRKLRHWNPGTGWTEPIATNSIAWAIADIAMAKYGAELPETRLNLQKLYELHNFWGPRGDAFNGVFDSQIAVMEALQTVARAGRAMVYTMMGVIEVVRDQYEPIPVMGFNQSSMIRNTFKIEYAIPDENTVDAIEVEYFDERYWQWKTVLCQLENHTAEKPAKVKFFGVTNKEQAWREGMYMAACNRYRRILPSFNTELAGYIPTPGDLVHIVHDMPDWGQGGTVIDYDGSSNILTASTELDWSGGNHVVSLIDQTGKPSDPINVSPVSGEPDKMQLGSNPPFPPYTGHDAAKTGFLFGPANTYKRDCRITGIRPVSGWEIEIYLVNEDIRVHQADETGNIPPDEEPWPVPEDPNFVKPGPIANLEVRQTGTPETPQLQAEWRPAEGAEFYVVEWALAVQNLLKWSEKLEESSVWTPNGAIEVTDNALIDPFGKFSLASLRSPADDPSDFISQTVDIFPYNETFTFAFFVECTFTAKFKVVLREPGTGNKSEFVFEVRDGEPVPVQGKAQVERVFRKLWRITASWFNKDAIDKLDVEIYPSLEPLQYAEDFPSMEGYILDSEVIPDDYIIQDRTVMGPVLALYAGMCSVYQHEGIQPYSRTEDIVKSASGGWTTAGTTRVTNLTFNVTYGSIWVRVAGVALMRGPYAYWHGDVYEIQPPGDVKNLQFQTDNNGTYFGITWDEVKNATTYAIQVLNYNDGTQLREVWTPLTEYIYTYENSIEDGGPFREVEFRVKAVGPGGASPNWATVHGGNPAPPPPGNIDLIPLAGNCVVTFTRPADRDFAGVLITISDQQGYTPTEADVIWDGTDTMAVIASMPDGTPLEPEKEYYLRFTSYDTFGKEDLNWDPNEYGFNVTKSDLTSKEILEMIRESLTNPGMQPMDGDFIFNSERFAVKVPDTNEDIYPFIISYIDEVAYVAIQGEILLLGNVSIDNLTEGELPTDVWMKLGGGSVVIHGSGYIAIYSDMETVDNRDFMLMTEALLATFVYRNNQYHVYKQLNRTEWGTAQSGETVEIPGYWQEMPHVTLTPLNIMTFDAAQADRNQAISLKATNLEQFEEGRWRFDAIAELQLSGGMGTTPVNHSSGVIPDQTWQAPIVDIPAGTNEIVVHYSTLSVRGTGTTTHEYYYRRCIVKVYTRPTTADDWVERAHHDIGFGLNISNPVVGDIPVTLGAGDTQLLVEFTAVDYDGSTFTLGPPEYNTQTETIDGTDTTVQLEGDVPFEKLVDMPDFVNVPPNPTNPRYDVTFERSCDLSDENNSIDLRIEPGGYAETLYAEQNYPPEQFNGTSTAWDYGGLKVIGEPRDGYINVPLYLRNIQATAKWDVLIVNSDVPQNQHTFVSFDWDKGEASIIAEGTLNWLAVGQ